MVTNTPTSGSVSCIGRPGVVVAIAVVALVLVSVVSPARAVTWPIDVGIFSAPVTSPFGPRCLGGYDYHAGIDLRISSSRNVVAVAAGTVVTRALWGGYDWTVVIRHGVGEGTWYSGYHHIDTDDDIYVVVGAAVTEGQLIARAGSNHLHFNYWEDTPINDDNTLHPFRGLGQHGGLHVEVAFNGVPVGALGVCHDGRILEVGVGIGWSSWDPFPATYLWNYEGNVRSSFTEQIGDFVPGDCYGGTSSVIGVSPQNYEPFTNNWVFFTFPTQLGQWIQGLPWTYAMDSAGNTVYIDEPVPGYFSEFRLDTERSKVTVVWSVSNPDEETTFDIYRGVQSNVLTKLDLPVVKQGDAFYFEDTDVQPGETYYYRITANLDGQSFVSRILEVTVPGAKKALSLGHPWPNPMTTETSVTLDGSASATFDLTVYDVSGRLVKRLYKGTPGDVLTAVQWDGTDGAGRTVSSGVYFLRLSEMGGRPYVRKLLVVR